MYERYPELIISLMYARSNQYSRFSLALQSNEIVLLKGEIFYLEKTLDYYVLYCQKNPTMSSVLIWHFFTIVDEYVWLVCFLVSFILGVTRLGEFTDLCVAFVRQGMRKR